MCFRPNDAQCVNWRRSSSWSCPFKLTFKLCDNMKQVAYLHFLWCIYLRNEGHPCVFFIMENTHLYLKTYANRIWDIYLLISTCQTKNILENWHLPSVCMLLFLTHIEHTNIFIEQQTREKYFGFKMQLHLCECMPTTMNKKMSRYQLPARELDFIE